VTTFDVVVFSKMASTFLPYKFFSLVLLSDVLN